MELQYAIVINVPTPGHTGYLIFDQTQGTMQVHGLHRRTERPLSRGCLIQFTTRVNKTWLTFDAVEMIAVPAQWAMGTIWFLHHLLEIIAFFLPRGHAAQDVFHICRLLYEPLPESIDPEFFKKFVLCKIFAHIGIYPEPTTHDERQFFLFIMTDAVSDCLFIKDEQKYVFLEKKMIQWLHACVQLHPHADRLKTTILEPYCDVEKINSTPEQYQ